MNDKWHFYQHCHNFMFGHDFIGRFGQLTADLASIILYPAILIHPNVEAS
jgi:hypothetical protein